MKTSLSRLGRKSVLKEECDILWDLVRFLVVAFTLVTTAQTSQAQVVSPTSNNIQNLSTGVAQDIYGNLYYANTSGNQIYELTADGSSVIPVCCKGLNKALKLPRSIAADSLGNIYIADTGNNRIVKVNSAGKSSVVSTRGLSLRNPSGLQVDTKNNLYVADSGNNHIVEITPTGDTSIMDIPGLSLNNPSNVFIDSAGNIDIADTGNNRVIEVSASGEASVVANGLNGPASIARDSEGQYYIADEGATSASSAPATPRITNGYAGVVMSLNSTVIPLTENDQPAAPTATVTMTLIPVNGFNKDLSLAFLGLPPSGVGGLTPPQFTFYGSTPILEQFKFGIINPGQYIYLSRRDEINAGLYLHGKVLTIASICPLSFLVLLGLRNKNLSSKKARKPLGNVMFMLVLAASLSVLSGCSGGMPPTLQNGGSTPGTASPTPYTMTIFIYGAGSSFPIQLGSFETVISHQSS